MNSSANKTIHLAVASDNKTLQKRIHDAASAKQNISRVSHYAFAQLSQGLPNTDLPDVLILHYEPTRHDNIITMLNNLRQRFPNLALGLLAERIGAFALQEALQFHVNGIVSGPTIVHDLISGLSLIHSGGLYLSAEAAERFETSRQLHKSGLKQIHKEVITTLVAYPHAGSRDVAEKLQISTSKLSRCIGRASKLLAAPGGRMALVMQALRLGLVEV